MRNDEIIDHLMEIKERLATIETKIENGNESHEETREQVKKNTHEITKAKASLKTLRWGLGIILMTLPASAAAIFKIWKP